MNTKEAHVTSAVGIQQAIAEDRAGQAVLNAVDRAHFASYVQKRIRELRESGKL